MNTAVVHELKCLAQESRLLLDCADSDVGAWEEYGERRAVIFARLGGMDFQVEGEEKILVANLLQEILEQDAVLVKRAQARLAHLGTEIRAAETSRRALRSYGSFLPALLLERCA